MDRLKTVLGCAALGAFVFGLVGYYALGRWLYPVGSNEDGYESLTWYGNAIVSGLVGAVVGAIVGFKRSLRDQD